MNYLPIFLDLKSKCILIVGGGVVAYRKTQLLIKTGAIIKILSHTLSPELLQLSNQKKIIWIQDVFHEMYLQEIYLVIAATNDHDLNKVIVECANKKFLLVNVVDDLKKCSFIFPSIVNRSPIIVAVSSSGNAPVLSKLIRNKIELLLPFKLGKVATLAGKLRNVVKKMFFKASERRYFWERIFNGSFIDAVVNNNLPLAMKLFYLSMNNLNRALGELILVGAGPGDVGLLTLRGFQVLQQADVVLYDYLIHKDMLNLVRFDARCIYVGKNTGDVKLSWIQSDINKLIVELVKDGKKVVRLKGGDPFVFGRGGDEIEAVKNIGGNFQIVPGITSSVGVTAYAGIPLTHRNYSSSVLLVNSCSVDFINGIDWLSLSKLLYTIVIYMCRTKSKLIFNTLLKNNFSLKTPVAIISNGTTVQQKVQIGQLHDLEKLINQSTGPTLLVIGKVVCLHKQFQWFNISNIS
ncbi:MAG: siroheme synthase CysG [Buchnera aphidicola (Eriosoma harunire)]